MWLCTRGRGSLPAVRADEFLTPHWYSSPRLAGSNPSVLGFFTEQMLLSWISREGCTSAGDQFGKRPKSIAFHGTNPQVDLEDGVSPYIPKFNFRAVDAILVFMDKRRDEAIVVGLQITIAERHSDSKAKFFRDWQWRKTILECKRVVFRFVWVVEDTAGKPYQECIGQSVRVMRESRTIHTPEFRRIYASVMGVSKGIGKKLRNARTTTLLEGVSTGRARGRGDGNAEEEVEEVVGASPEPGPDRDALGNESDHAE